MLPIRFRSPGLPRKQQAAPDCFVALVPDRVRESYDLDAAIAMPLSNAGARDDQSARHRIRLQRHVPPLDSGGTEDVYRGKTRAGLSTMAVNGPSGRAVKPAWRRARDARAYRSPC